MCEEVGQDCVMQFPFMVYTESPAQSVCSGSQSMQEVHSLYAHLVSDVPVPQAD